jgi:NADPH:quinone reductase-like Zn-dependent oxidoreductase
MRWGGGRGDEVLKVGKGVKGFKPGDLVSVLEGAEGGMHRALRDGVGRWQGRGEVLKVGRGVKGFKPGDLVRKGECV